MQSASLHKALGMLRGAFGEQEEYVTAELVLATLLESARLGSSGPATVAASARRRVDTPGGGGQIPGDTPWHPGQATALSKYTCCLPCMQYAALLACLMLSGIPAMSCGACAECRGA